MRFLLHPLKRTCRVLKRHVTKDFREKHLKKLLKRRNEFNLIMPMIYCSGKEHLNGIVIPFDGEKF